MLPLGLRVHDKIERLIDKHMRKLGASKLSLSSISSEELWRKSGRLENARSDLFQLRDRKENRYILSPTHEEEITSLVAGVAKSYKALPLRLYQTSRKYRDEPRPRLGLQRGREFSMKDLYTFDSDVRTALETYSSVRDVYSSFFEEFKIPFLVAIADSGKMGGSTSHEYHYASQKGEDNIISCENCGYTANEELAESRITTQHPSHNSFSWSHNDHVYSDGGLEMGLEALTNDHSASEKDPFHLKVSVWSGITQDRLTLVNVFHPSTYQRQALPSLNAEKISEVNIHAIKSIVPSLDPGIGEPIKLWKKNFLPWNPDSEKNSKILNIFDYRLPATFFSTTFSNHADLPLDAQPSHYISKQIPTTSTSKHPKTNAPLDVLRIQNEDACPKCPDGKLRVQKSIELGHTFFLGARYTVPLGATVSSSQKEESFPQSDVVKELASESQGCEVPIQMGCYGIGVSRLIAAIADSLCDIKGLNWPRAVAPFEAVIISNQDAETDAEELYDRLASIEKGFNSNQAASSCRELVDFVLDDRSIKIHKKLFDADLVGFPVIIVLGRRWKDEKLCEVQCRLLGIVKTDVSVDELHDYVSSLLAKL
ncbi:MAG: hypothetical protein M1829_000708 [Trizodia sp. TS-e1964]|nr:MAG: hypothetical protein M1829_000708 [Trizodia sp. TS-e1964]